MLLLESREKVLSTASHAAAEQRSSRARAPPGRSAQRAERRGIPAAFRSSPVRSAFLLSIPHIVTATVSRKGEHILSRIQRSLQVSVFKHFWESTEKTQEGPAFLNTSSLLAHLYFDSLSAPARGMHRMPRETLEKQGEAAHGKLKVKRRKQTSVFLPSSSSDAAFRAFAVLLRGFIHTSYIRSVLFLLKIFENVFNTTSETPKSPNKSQDQAVAKHGLIRLHAKIPEQQPPDPEQLGKLFCSGAFSLSERQAITPCK
ncbi:hypothetical protein CB1_000764028 [Camelus ferus]|nr:hypothetical protein CB1_000764028 [Camelus ferus]